MLVFEDLHWADDGLLDFVDHLADWATTVPLLIVATARPELLDRRPGWGGGKRNAFTLSIGALSDEETAQLLQHAPRPRRPRRRRAAGGAAARGRQPALRRGVRADARRARVTDELPLPETVQGLIAARIDGLAPDGEDAPPGRIRDRQGLLARRPLADARRTVLHALERKEFVRRDRRSAIAGETQYAFLHALVRDVAYGQIPRADRAGEAPPRGGVARVPRAGPGEDHAEMLAHHYREALNWAHAAGIDVTALRAPARQAFADAAAAGSLARRRPAAV